MPVQKFILNGKRVSVRCEDDVCMLWVLRDLLGVTGPKYGCGIGACQACTSHINGKAVNLCCVPVGRMKPTDQVTTIEGLARTVKADLHPMQEAWLKHDVAQCGFCQPGQIMAAVAKVQEVKGTQGKKRITNKDIDEIRNMCRCGTYPRIRAAIREGSANMKVVKVQPRPKKKATGKKRAKASSDEAGFAGAVEAAVTE
jgi:isoquinoline 1-oxidoreductase subunit alpha